MLASPCAARAALRRGLPLPLSDDRSRSDRCGLLCERGANGHGGAPGPGGARRAWRGAQHSCAPAMCAPRTAPCPALWRVVRTSAACDHDVRSSGHHACLFPPSFLPSFLSSSLLLSFLCSLLFFLSSSFSSVFFFPLLLVLLICGRSEQALGRPVDNRHPTARLRNLTAHCSSFTAPSLLLVELTILLCSATALTVICSFLHVSPPSSNAGSAVRFLL